MECSIKQEPNKQHYSSTSGTKAIAPTPVLPQADRQHHYFLLSSPWDQTVALHRLKAFTLSPKKKSQKILPRSVFVSPQQELQLARVCGWGEGLDNPSHPLSSSAPVISRKSPCSRAAALTQSVSQCVSAASCTATSMMLDSIRSDVIMNLYSQWEEDQAWRGRLYYLVMAIFTKPTLLWLRSAFRLTLAVFTSTPTVGR